MLVEQNGRERLSSPKEQHVQVKGPFWDSALENACGLPKKQFSQEKNLSGKKTELC